MMLDIVIEFLLMMFECVEKFLVGQSDVLPVGVLDEQSDVETMIVGLFFVVLNDHMIGSSESGRVSSERSGRSSNLIALISALEQLSS